MRMEAILVQPSVRVVLPETDEIKVLLVVVVLLLLISNPNREH